MNIGKVIKTKLLFLSFCIGFLPMAMAGEKDARVSFDQISKLIEHYALSNLSKAFALLNEAKNTAARSADSTLLFSYILYWESTVNYNQGINDSTLAHQIIQKINRPELQQHPFELALLNYALAYTYYIDGDYVGSFIAALQALEEFKTLKNNLFISKIYALLGNICSNIRSYEMAEDYYNQSIELLRQGPEKKDRVYMNLYTVWGLSGKASLAIDSLSVMIPQLIETRDTAILVLLYLNLGTYYSRERQQEKLKECCDSILPLMSGIENDRLSFGLYQNLGAYYMYNQQFHEALSYFNKAKNISIKDGNWSQLAYTYLGLSNLFRDIKRVDSAYVYLSLYKELNEKKTENSRVLDVYRTYISTALESTQKELTIAAQSLKLKNRSLIIIIGSAIAAIIVIMLFLIVVQQKKRIKDAENRELEKQLQSQRLIEHLQQEHIETQAREITTHALMLSNKNQVLQQIMEVVKTLPGNKEETRTINYIIKSNLNNDQSWKNVIMHFEKVHPDFFNKLKVLSKDLTENNLRLCAYLRIGIPLKQIAQMLNVSHGSIIIQRYRLKKKLNLGEEEDLDEFIRTI